MSPTHETASRPGNAAGVPTSAGPTPADWPRSLLETATLAARAAALVHEDAAGKGGGRWVDVKTAASDFVCDVDLAAQRAALEVITTRHPDHAVLAEEEGGGQDAKPGNDCIWLVDPLDGTTNFLHGHPFHAASVAVWDGTGPLAAAVDARALGKVWTALRGRGAHENGERMQVSRTTRFSRFLIGTGFPFKSHEFLDRFLPELGRMLRQTSGVRRTGAASVDLAYLAGGILDGFWEHRLGPWDYGAGVLLVSEAGGAVERIKGGPVGLDAGSVLAANSVEGLQMLRGVLGAPEPNSTR